MDDSSLKIQQHYWAPFQPMVLAVESLAAEKKTVLEIGPGPLPFSKATAFVDWQAWPVLAGRPVHTLDINQDALPFPDKSFDFVYCRHTLEDLYNPFWVCREMSRVGCAGYIETPSPIAECGRGVDAGSPAWRGYHHHRYVVWVENGRLMFVPKYPLIEYVNFGDAESEIVALLNAHPMFWNTYYFWEGSLTYHMLQHDQEIRLAEDYRTVLLNAVKACAAETQRIASRYISE
jgi:hypothetical protein